MERTEWVRCPMDYKETDFSFLYDDLTREYGNEQAYFQKIAAGNGDILNSY